jgi:hypothetical protein
MTCRFRTMAVLLLAAVLAVTAARADEWDEATERDDGILTDNALFHGAQQVHDLARHIGPVVDQDWFVMAMEPFASYEVVVDGQTGDLLLGGNQVQRMDVNGNLVQNGDFNENPGTVRLKWRTGAVASSVANYVRVSNPGCDTACDALDRYRIRFYETTYTVPRFNNAGSQATVLVVQNVTSSACQVMSAYFRSDGGTLTTHVAELAARSTFVLPTATLAPLAGQSGSIRLLHTCGYDGLSGKAVSIEPATGFTFDTAIVPRPR